jgi:hypothetical protein
MTEHKTILAALAAALPELESAKKNKANPAFKSKYADFGAIVEAIEPIRKHGLWFRQFSHDRDGGSAVETFYIHDTGELSAGIYFVPAEKNNAHGYGSANSYARRYGLQLAFGLATEDDDGNAASAKPTNYNAQRIDRDQLENVQDLIAATQSDVVAICKKLKINGLNEMTLDQYNYVVGVLQKKKG